METPVRLIQHDMFGYHNPTAGAELVQVNRPVHTGERASKDWERVQEILSAYASGESIRSVCSRFHVGHNTLSKKQGPGYPCNRPGIEDGTWECACGAETSGLISPLGRGPGFRYGLSPP